MTMLANPQVLRTITLLIAVCLTSFDAQAQYSGGNGTTASAETNTYLFLPGQSTVVQTGGIAGVHWTYSLEGLFQLTVAPDAGTASFAHVDANATDDSPLRRTLDPNEVFKMTSLLGAVLDDTTISFTGKADDDSDVLITVTIEDNLAYLVGQTIPPPNTADFFLFSLDAVAQRKYGGGTGEPNDPYLIYTAEHLNAIGAEPNDWDKHFKLMADIDLSGFTGTDFNIIGYAIRGRVGYSKPFTGVFDGNGKKISNFSYISTDRSYIGLFGYVADPNAVIKNVGLIDPNVDPGDRDCVGSLVGSLSIGTIFNCYAEGGNVSGDAGAVSVGGLVGRNGGTITNCNSSGSVSGSYNVGGLVGINDGTITNCYATGSVSGNKYVGGLVGGNGGAVTHCYSTGWISGSTSYVGIRAIGSSSVGGLVGWHYDGIITNCYATGSVTSDDYVGGLVGLNWGATITDCYSTGSVSGDLFVGGVGGLVGGNWDGTITNCYATGSVMGGSFVGGLVGENWGEVTGEVTDSFWDTQTSGQVTSGGGTGKTTAQMQMLSTFTSAGWDFWNLWSICEGMNYPVFLWQIPVGDFVCPDGINFIDFAFFADHWGQNNCNEANYYCEGTDLDFSGTVDEADLEILVENWLAGVRSD